MLEETVIESTLKGETEMLWNRTNSLRATEVRANMYRPDIDGIIEKITKCLNKVVGVKRYG